MDDALVTVGGVVISVETIKKLPEIIEKLGEAIKKIGEGTGFFANKKKIEEQKEELTNLKSELAKLQAAIKNSGLLVIQYNELFNLSTKSEALCSSLLDAIREADTGVYLLAPEVEQQAGEIIRKFFHDIKDAYQKFEKSVEDNKPLLQEEDYDGFTKSRIPVNRYIGIIENYLKEAKYRDAATNIEMLKGELGAITSIIQQRLNTIGNELILAKP